MTRRSYQIRLAKKPPILASVKRGLLNKVAICIEYLVTLTTYPRYA